MFRISRISAAIIDIGIAMAAFSVSALFDFLIYFGQVTPPVVQTIVYCSVLMIAFPELLTGSSLGKLFVGIRVAAGRNRMVKLLLRWFFKWIPLAAFPFVMAVNNQTTRLHLYVFEASWLGILFMAFMAFVFGCSKTGYDWMLSTDVVNCSKPAINRGFAIENVKATAPKRRDDLGEEE